MMFCQEYGQRQRLIDRLNNYLIRETGCSQGNLFENRYLYPYEDRAEPEVSEALMTKGYKEEKITK